MVKRKRKLAAPRQYTVKVHYGPPKMPELFWSIKVVNAKKDITIKGKMLHVIKGVAGFTVGCHLSNCAQDKANGEAFGHPVILASVTKSKMTIVTKITNGAPSHGVIYEHSYGRFVDLNDTKEGRRFFKINPEFAERDFTFKAPRLIKRGASKGGAGRAALPISDGKSRRAVVPYGALRRAILAGLIAKPVAQALTATA